MTLKRILLSFITLLVAFLVGSSLISSFNEPQVTSRLQLYQTDLLLQATEWNGGEILEAEDLQAVRNSLLGEKPLKTAVKQYQEVREEAQENLTRSRTQLQQQTPDPANLLPDQPPEVEQAAPVPSTQKLQRVIQQLQPLVEQLDLRIGLLRAEMGQLQAAQTLWSDLQTDAAQISPSPEAQTAAILSGLWQEPPQIGQNAETIINQNLEGWFRFQALERLYTLQQRDTALAAIQAAQQEAAEQTFIQLATISFLPGLGVLIGIGLSLFLIAQAFLKGKQSLLARNWGEGWTVPWDGETIWQVLIVGFFFVGQVVLPLILGGLGLSGGQFSGRSRAFYSLAYYLLMASGGILVLVWSIRSYLPLPEGWFRFKWLSGWPFWGLGGYFVALPLMIGVSIVNQQIWQGQGGSNPLLQTVLEEGDMLALLVFFLTAAIAAPLFEETLFRGFLLPSLTRYMSQGWAIVASSFLFAIAHLSLSEVLPLMTLGMVLGFVYTRSRNLLSPMLLHSLWNSATMIGLFILGNSAR